MSPLGILVGARLLVDFTDTRVKDKISNFNGNKRIASVRSLIFTTETGALLGMHVGWGGNEPELAALESSPIFQSLVSELAEGEKFFLADGSLRNKACYFPVNRPELAAASIDDRRALLAYNAALQARRARVEHAIAHAKHRWGAIADIPGIMHMSFDDIVDLIFLSWLLEARVQRLHS